MAIVVNNNITIPTNGDYADANGTKVTEVVANGITVWKKVTAIVAKNAPPFNGWGSLSSGGAAYVSNGQLVGGTWGYDGYWESATISSNEINIYIHIFAGQAGDLLVYSPMFSTSEYNRFSVYATNYYEDVDEECRVIRYSNDGETWTNWMIGNTVSHSYKYAQAGYWAKASQDWDGEDTGYGVIIHNVTFS